ncbi:unnamed protein product [Pleuronectes platessa]|uniref:Uncharacterized protein n=1 Tax=Pleuronectes platessa TaxID=8262 RepID=A0A9N7UMS3_PLEPL|nr:unnamed protein product [Pleuronectes platessa]
MPTVTKPDMKPSPQTTVRSTPPPLHPPLTSMGEERREGIIPSHQSIKRPSLSHPSSLFYPDTPAPPHSNNLPYILTPTKGLSAVPTSPILLPLPPLACQRNTNW